MPIVTNFIKYKKKYNKAPKALSILTKSYYNKLSLNYFFMSTLLPNSSFLKKVLKNKKNFSLPKISIGINKSIHRKDIYKKFMVI